MRRKTFLLTVRMNEYNMESHSVNFFYFVS